MPRLMQHDGSTPRRRRLHPLLSTCAWATVAAVSLYPQSAGAQAFQGTPETGNISRTPTSGTTETIAVNSSRTIVNWRIAPTGNTFTFLPAGNVATFTNGDGVSDYLVINRILSNNGTSPRVDFLGSVISRIDNSPGGRIWFYAPGGILVGPNAVFDVGSLLLTANDPVEILDEMGYGTGSYRFTAAAGSSASVVNQGRITAAGSDAYVAMIAPRVQQAGTVRVNGSAAYVAAEQVDLTINGTLFDINVGIGSDADAPGGNTLEHTGTTITEDPGAANGAAPRQVVLVAVPKNNAVTMLVTGNLGYEAASSASLDGGRIVLSAGFNVDSGTITTRAGGTTANADIEIANATFNAETIGFATGDIGINNADGADRVELDADGDITGTGLLSAGTDLQAIAGGDIALGAVDAGGSLLLQALDGSVSLDTGSAGTDLTLFGLVSIAADTLDAGDDMNIQTFVGDGDPLTPRTVTLGTATAGGDMFVGTFGALQADSLTVTGPGQLFAGSSTSIRIGSMSSGGDVELFLAPTSPSGFTLADGRGGMEVGTIEADGNINAFNEASSITFGTATAGGQISVQTLDPDVAFAGFTADSLTAGTGILIDLSGAADLGAASAGTDLEILATAIDLLDGSAGRDITLEADGNIVVGMAEAGDDFRAIAGGTFTGSNVDATGLGEDSEDNGESAPDGSNIVIESVGDLRLDDGTAADTIDLASSAGNILSSGTLTSTELLADTVLNLTLNDVFVIEDLNLTTTNGSITGNSFNSDGSVNLDSSQDIAVAGIDAGGSATLSADGNANAGTVDAGVDININAENITLADGTAGRDIDLVAGGDIDVARAEAGDDFLASAGGSFTGGTVITTGAGPDDNAGNDAVEIQGPAEVGGASGSNIEIRADGDIVLDRGDAFNSLTLVSANGEISSSQRLEAGDDIFLQAPGDITVAFGQAGDDFDAITDANFIGGTILTTGVAGGLPGETVIFFADFSSAEGLQLNGNAALATLNGRPVLRVTPAAFGQSGSAFSTQPVPLDDNFSFSTRFTINLNNFGGAGGGADGIVFVIQTVSNTSGGAGGGIGYQGLPNSAGVEFDTFNNGGGDAFNNNHVGLDLNGDVNSVVLVPLTDLVLNSATDLTVYIDYNGATNQLEVRITDQSFRPVLPTLTASVDLATVLGTPEAFVGFTSGTGAGFANHDVVNWEFRNTFSPVVAQNVGANINIRAGGNIDLGTASAAGDVTLNSTAGTLVNASQISAAGLINVQSAGAIDVDAASAGTDLLLDAEEDLTLGFAQAGEDAMITAGGQLTAGDVTAAAGAMMLSAAGGPLQAGDLRSRLALTVATTGGALSAGDVESTGGSVQFNSLGDMTVGNVRAAGSIFLTGGGAITALDLTANTGPVVGGTGVTQPGIAPGFDDFVFPRNDDGSTGPIPLPFLLNYFGQQYDQTFVSNNGYLTFNSGQGTFTPSGLGENYSGQPIIAGFFADVDTRNPGSAVLTYGQGTYAGRTAFGATWNGVGYYNSQADKLNNFQIILVDRSDTGAGNFDIYYNYTRISWETGSASGGTNGFGGVSAAVGFNAGTGNQPGTFFELAGSRVPGSFLDTGTMPLILGTNNGVPGQLAFQVRNGQVTPGAGGSGDIRVTNIASGNTGDISLGNLDGRNIEVEGANRVTTGSVDADETVSLSATNVLTYASSQSGEMTTLAGLGIVGGATTAETDLVATAGANGITLTSGTAGGDLTFESGGDIAIQTVDAGGDVTLESQNGRVLVSNDLIAGDRIEAVGRSVELNALGPLTVALVNATGGDAEVNSGGDLTLLGVTATQNVSATSGGTLALNGNVTGQQIDLASRDLAVAAAARIGTITGTNQINIIATGPAGAPVTLGGAAGGTGYRLDNTEFAAFAARSIRFSNEVPDGTLRVEDFSARGAQGQNPNVTQELSIESANNIEVVGTVALNEAGEANELAFVAGNEFFADAATADISVTNGTALAGELSIEADSIVIASRAAADETEALATTAERNDRLGQNDGEINEEGYIRANSVVLAASERIWVQNSGSSNQVRDRRGITAGSGGITLVGNGEGSVEIIINGQQADSAGGFTTGRNLIDLVEIEGGFAQGSTINGCLISGFGCSPPEFTLIPPVQDVVQSLLSEDQEDEEDSDTLGRPPLVRLGSLIRLLGFPFAPVVDEPVTGSGNEDQWQEPNQLIETPPSPPQDQVIDQPVTGSGNEDRPNDGDSD